MRIVRDCFIKMNNSIQSFCKTFFHEMRDFSSQALRWSTFSNLYFMTLSVFLLSSSGLEGGERERQRETETERKTERQTDRHRQRDRDRDRDRERVRGTERQTDGQTDREK